MIDTKKWEILHTELTQSKTDSANMHVTNQGISVTDFKVVFVEKNNSSLYLPGVGPELTQTACR